MDYILRKLKETPKRKTTPKMVITSPGVNKDSPNFDFDLRESLSLNSPPIQHNQLNQHNDHNHHNCHRHDSSHSSLNSSLSRSSCSSEDADNSSTISTIRKV